MIDLEEAVRLIEKAFDQAREKGRVDWYLMAPPVLNNRLLSLTDRKFDPRRYGAKDLKELLVRLAPWVQLRKNEKSYIVEWRGHLLAAPSGSSPPAILKSGGVREDLWTAVVDYRSGKKYVWDFRLGCAREAVANDQNPVLPTLIPVELQVWRSEFLEAHKSGLEGVDLARLQRWKEESLSTVNLPQKLQSIWNKELTRRIRTRLEAFFAEHANDEIASNAVSQSDGTPIVDAPLLNEEAIRTARERGHTYIAGEILARAFAKADDELLELLLARAIAAWASPLQPAREPSSMQELVVRSDEFPAANLAIAVVVAIFRAKQHKREVLGSVGDLAFKVREEICRRFELDERVRPLEALKSAIAKLEESLARMEMAVDSFLKATPATAKIASVEVLKAGRQLQRFVLPAERTYLREIDLALGPVFRKFCECHERHDDTEVIRRAPELREVLARSSQSPSDGKDLSSVWLSFVAPILQHINALVDQATATGEVSLSPVLALMNPATKANLCSAGGETRLTFRLANSGHGQALDVTMEALAHSFDAIVELVEPRGEFSIGARSDQLVVLAILVGTPVPTLELPLKWICRTASGAERIFVDRISVSQQSVEPDWGRLLADPPYSLNPIKRRDRLFGRDSTLHQVRLAALAGASTFLWGQKRIGKTSLLQVLATELGSRSDTSCLVLRMGEVTSLHEGQLAHRIAVRLAEGVGATDLVPKEDHLGAGMNRLVPFVESLMVRRPDHKFVVVIDEFDDLDPAFYTGERGRQFIKALRSLSEIGLTFFFVGSERMDTIYSRHQSDLNKWRNIALDKIDNRNDCKALIAEPVRGAIEYSQDAIDSIVDYCGGNPFYIHNLCYQVFERCVQDHRTFVGEDDLQAIKHQLLQSLGQTNFAHFWEDNPELDVVTKVRQSAENCIALSCIAACGGSYGGLEELLQVQESFPISSDDRAGPTVMRGACERLKMRRILAAVPNEEGFRVSLPIFREWLTENADPKLLSIWTMYSAHARAAVQEDQVLDAPILDVATFPIPEDDLIAISQRLVYCGHQKDAAEIRQWLRQFDDENRIEIAYLLLKRLTERGFVNEGTRSRMLHRLSEMIGSRRLEVGNGRWNVVRGRYDNLCITYVDSEHKSGATTARELQKLMRPVKCAASSEVGVWMKSRLEDDVLVIVADDFAGTGRTLAGGLKSFEQHVEPTIWKRYLDEGRIAAYVMFAFPNGLMNVQRSCPGIEVMAAQTFGHELLALDEDADIFADESERRFASEMLTQIGRELTPQSPLGYGDQGALVVFHNASPNNTLPIFWSGGRVSERQWKPLFPRA